MKRSTTTPWALLVIPGGIVLVAFFALPLALMAGRSVADPSPANYLVFTSSDIYVRVLANTFMVAATCTVVCLVLGYPYAYAMHRAGPKLAPTVSEKVAHCTRSKLLRPT